MGNCGSSAKVEKPVRVSDPISVPKQDDDIEEIKTPDKYCKPSGELYSMNEDFTGRRNDKDWAKRDMSRRSSRSYSAFNLQKDIIESLKNEERIRRFENPSSEFREKNDATSYKITEEQHFSIYMFVEEKNRIIYEEIFKLFTHLIRNMQEHEDLSLIIEGLRCNNKDVENCIEDLQAHPVDNEKYFYRTIEKNSGLIRVIVSEYNTYRKNIKNYRGFREVVLSNIKQYNLSQQDTGVSEETPEWQSFKEKPKSDTYDQFIKDFNKLKEEQIALNEMFEVLKTEKANKIADNKNHFLERVKISKLKHQELESQINTALSKLERSTEEHLVSPDGYTTKLKKLSVEVKRQLESLNYAEGLNFEKENNSKITFYTKFSEALEKGSASLKKFGSDRMFLDGKPASSAKIEVRKGDNIDIELEILNENEESPNLADKLKGLNSIEPSPTKPKYLPLQTNYL